MSHIDESATWLLEKSPERSDLIAKWFKFREADCQNALERALRVAYGGARDESMPADVVAGIGKLRQQARFNALLAVRALECHRGHWEAQDWTMTIRMSDAAVKAMLACVGELDELLAFSTQIRDECGGFAFSS